MRQISTTAKVLGLTMAVFVMGCETVTPPPFEPRSLQQSERDRAREVPLHGKNPLPTTLQSPFLSENTTARQVPPPTTGPALESDTVMRLPLQEIIQRAVSNNLDVKVAGYQPAIDEARVTEAEARFDPAFFQNVTYARTDRDQGIFSPGNARSIQSRTGIRQNLTSGGQAELRYQTGWTDAKRSRGVLGSMDDPVGFWENELVLEVTQPLLRDFGSEVNRARITINRNNHRISLLDFRDQLEEIVGNIEETYWNLVTAERTVRIREQLLGDTLNLAEVLYKRRGQDVTRVQLSQANARVEERRADLVLERARVRQLSDTLKQLMNDPQLPVASGVLILPANLPAEEPIRFDLKDQIDTALENRLELGQQQLRVDSAGIATKVAQNNLLPQLDVVGSLGVQGLNNDLGDAYGDQADWKNVSYSIGLEFEVPIGNREARAIYQRSLLQRQQEIGRYRSLIESISLDVKNRLRDVDATWDEMVARRQARFAFTDQLGALKQREDGGEALTPDFVRLQLDAQSELAQARVRESEAVSSYNTAIARLEQSKGTLLRYNNIVMEEDSLPFGRGVR